MFTTPRAHVFGYILDTGLTPLAEREATISTYVSTNLPELTFRGFFTDEPRHSSILVRRRPAGVRIAGFCRPGDHLVFDCSRDFTTDKDLRQTLKWLAGLRVTLHLLDLDLVSTDAKAVELLLKSQAVSTERMSMRSKRAHQRQKEMGQPVNLFCKPGYRWVREKGTLYRFRRLDPDEWPVVLRIGRLKRQGALLGEDQRDFDTGGV